MRVNSNSSSCQDCCNIVAVYVRVMVINGVSGRRYCNSINGCMDVVHTYVCVIVSVVIVLG